METRRTSEKAKKGEPDRDTMEEKVRMDRGQREFITSEDTTLDKITKTLLVITAMEKGKPRAIDVHALQIQEMRRRKTTYVRSPVECRSKMTRAVWEVGGHEGAVQLERVQHTVEACSLNPLQGERVPDQGRGP